MRKLFYYQPIVTAIANCGSVKFGFTAETQMWEADKPRRKMNLSVHGKTKEEALEKFNNSLKSEDTDVTELPCSYYLCSEAVFTHFRPFEVSKPFKSGYEWDKDNYYVAWLNFEEVEKFHNEVIGDNWEIDFWCRECVPGTMNDSTIFLPHAKKNGIFVEFEEKLSLTNAKNRAMIICNLASRYGCTPVQLINKYL